jgi:hypothetical protein
MEFSCISGFRARAFGAPRNDGLAFFNSLLDAVVITRLPRRPAFGR